MLPSCATDLKVRKRNLIMMADPRSWPTWPVLPLVRRHADGTEEQGALYDAVGRCGRYGLSATVFFCNIFLLPGTLDEFLALPHETYDTPEEVYAAGWRVD